MRRTGSIRAAILATSSLLLPAGGLRASPQSSQQPVTAPTATKPAISGISPTPLKASSSAQRLTLQGSNFPADKSQAGVTLTAPAGQTAAGTSQILEASAERIVFEATLAQPGEWSVTVKDKKSGAESAPLAFSVQAAEATAAGCRPEGNWPSVRAFWSVFWLMTVVLGVLFGAAVISLTLGQWRRHSKEKWRLASALAEKASPQPHDVEGKPSVVLPASASRTIALFGLFGILTVVVGIGYALVWNILVCGTIPELDKLRTFLVAMAAVFAPYLANQLRGIFSRDGKDDQAGAAKLPGK